MRHAQLVCSLTFPLILLTACSAPTQNSGHKANQAEGRARAEKAPAAPRPHIVSRSEWHADEKAVRERASYVHRIRAAFIHHTDQPNTYDCGDVPRMLRSLEHDHVRRGWDDIGYNFVVDHCGTIYEGRGGGVNRPVRGAHTPGFNGDSVGIAALGTFDDEGNIPSKMLASMAAVIAWKLPPDADPYGRVHLKSDGNQSKYKIGDVGSLRVISGHRDAYETDCPGKALYEELPHLRDEVARIRDHYKNRR